VEHIENNVEPNEIEDKEEIIDFFGFVYNEFIILFCFGLEYDTKFDISSRVELTENQPIEMIDEVELEGEYKIDLNIQTPENNN